MLSITLKLYQLLPLFWLTMSNHHSILLLQLSFTGKLPKNTFHHKVWLSFSVKSHGFKWKHASHMALQKLSISWNSVYWDIFCICHLYLLNGPFLHQPNCTLTSASIILLRPLLSSCMASWWPIHHHWVPKEETIVSVKELRTYNPHSFVVIIF